eukprot:CAMPEP_0206481260 /NCGR_PEP_ID=MMETSP0324_2-20121206/38031_1 /ASSEMBLY_ACC=CAM_ASM_000836 /TAXON_ID=2866 /ORGANISM="Crypthecodinium cohnii, Strain Seligo" /LENGTH=181 /DNA_ID=CAMNT_0053958699 /DNA_START=67 /DNA_END=612 /DNA_ORIENTATION=+
MPSYWGLYVEADFSECTSFRLPSAAFVSLKVIRATGAGAGDQETLIVDLEDGEGRCAWDSFRGVDLVAAPRADREASVKILDPARLSGLTNHRVRSLMKKHATDGLVVRSNMPTTQLVAALECEGCFPLEFASSLTVLVRRDEEGSEEVEVPMVQEGQAAVAVAEDGTTIVFVNDICFRRL